MTLFRLLDLSHVFANQVLMKGGTLNDIQKLGPKDNDYDFEMSSFNTKA